MTRTRADRVGTAASSPGLVQGLVLLLVVVFATTPTAQARGEWYDHYEDGIAALDAGNARRAIDLLEKALAQKERSGYLRTYGNNYIHYVPWFYLGAAWYEAGDCTQALHSFELSAAASETESLPELAKRLSSIRAVCETSLQPEVAETDPPAEEPVVVEEPPIRLDAGILERGLAAYLSGELGSAAVSFEELIGSEPRSARPHALLGAALYGSWLVGGESDDALLRRARNELKQAASLDPALNLDPLLYPPRVIALYRSLD